MSFKIFRFVICTLLASQLVGCASTESLMGKIGKAPPRASKLVDISVLGRARTPVSLPTGSRIVIAGIAGNCDVELRNALAKRLVDNQEFQVLDRDNLDLILLEADTTWGGRFNSRTAVQLGELLGASMFIVGQVIYCGTPEGEEFPPRNELGSWAPDGEEAQIYAVLQVIDPSTGKVIMSSANNGQYSPRTEALLFDSPASKTWQFRAPLVKKSLDGLRDLSPFKGVGKILFPSRMAAVDALDDLKKEKNDQGGEQVRINYSAFKAAEDLSNGFADKLFSRPFWEKVEMWDNPDWKYGESLSAVKLGRCEQALEVFEREFPEKAGLEEMPFQNVAEHLHNYGVALLCANKPTEAMVKLRSAFRIGNQQSTLRMLGFAGKLIEHDIAIEVDQQPEVDIVIDRREALSPQIRFGAVAAEPTDVP